MPTLETERLRVRPFVLDDLAAAHTLLDQQSEQGWAVEQRREWLQWNVLSAKYLAELDQPPYGDRAFVLKTTGELVGAVGVVPYVDSFGRIAALAGAGDGVATAEVGLYWVTASSQRGQGFATEAAAAVCGYLFEHERLGRIIATTGAENLASQAVMRKLGMVVQSAASPRPPDTFVVGVLNNYRAREWSR
jgi:RimJ/RimL family protein N-acetyltransferase